MKIENIPTIDHIVNKHHLSDSGFCRHYLTLYSIILGMESKNVFEFGCGFSTIVMVAALKLTNGQLTSVDLRSLSSIDGITESFSEENKDIWKFIQGDSLEVAPKLNHEECYDVVLHDGSHKGSEIIVDLNNISPFIKTGGIVLIHDTAHYELGEEMRKAVSDCDLVKNYNHEVTTLPYGYGLTIIRVLDNPNNDEKVKITWRKGI